MHISNERYFHDRQRHDLALRMIRHEARTCTIRSCTGLTDDRIRRLYKTYASHMPSAPVRRRRGKSPRQVASSSATRGRSSNRRCSRACSRRSACGAGSRAPSSDRTVGPIEFGRACSATRTKRTASCCATPRSRSSMHGSCCSCCSRNADLHAVALPTLRQSVLAGSASTCRRRACPVCALEANGHVGNAALIQSRAWRRRALIPTFWPDRISNAPRTGARTKRVCARRSRDPATLFVPVWHDAQPGHAASDGRAAPISSTGAQRFADVDASGLHPARRVSRACRASRSSSRAKSRRRSRSGAEFHDLRLIAGELPPTRPGCSPTRARWCTGASSHRFCGRCGSPTLALQGGHVLQCSDAACAHSAISRESIRPSSCWSRTASAHCSAARRPGRRAGIRPIAGFVEPGESLEDAVAREVPRGNRRRRRRGRLSLVAALAVPVLADARLHRARQPAPTSTRATTSWRSALAHPRADRGRRSRAADDTLDLLPPDRGLVRRRRDAAAAAGAGRAHVAAAAAR